MKSKKSSYDINSKEEMFAMHIFNKGVISRLLLQIKLRDNQQNNNVSKMY